MSYKPKPLALKLPGGLVVSHESLPVIVGLIMGDSIIVSIATCGSTSVRILPLGFGGQPLAIPVGIGFCLSSTDENHGVIVKGGIFFNFGLAFEVVSALLHKFSELTHGSLYVEGVQLHLMRWRRMVHPFLASLIW